MRCPKCGYVSFEYRDICKKCGKELSEFKKKAGIMVLEPAYLDLDRYPEGRDNPEGRESEGLEDEDLPGSLDLEEEEASADANAEESGIELDQEPEIDLNEIEENPSSESGGASPSGEPEVEGDIDFSSDPEEKNAVAEEEAFDATDETSPREEDITGEIDLMLEEIEDLNPEES